MTVDRQVGTLDVYTIQPRAWTARELEAMGEFASVAADKCDRAAEERERAVEPTGTAQGGSSDYSWELGIRRPPDWRIHPTHE